MAPEPSVLNEINWTAEDVADAEALTDLDAGRAISHAAVKRWLESWGTTDERPPPIVGD